MSQGKIAVITGGSAGFGAATVRQLARRGWRVIAGARRLELVHVDRELVRLDVATLGIGRGIEIYDHRTFIECLGEREIEFFACE